MRQIRWMRFALPLVVAAVVSACSGDDADATRLLAEETRRAQAIDKLAGRIDELLAAQEKRGATLSDALAPVPTPDNIPTAKLDSVATALDHIDPRLADAEQRIDELARVAHTVKAVGNASPEAASTDDPERDAVDYLVRLLEKRKQKEEEEKWAGVATYVGKMRQHKLRQMCKAMGVDQQTVGKDITKHEDEYKTRVEAIWKRLETGEIDGFEAKRAFALEEASTYAWLRRILSEEQLQVYNRHSGGVRNLSNRTKQR